MRRMIRRVGRKEDGKRRGRKGKEEKESIEEYSIRYNMYNI